MPRSAAFPGLPAGCTARSARSATLVAVLCVCARGLPGTRLRIRCRSACRCPCRACRGSLSSPGCASPSGLSLVSRLCRPCNLGWWGADRPSWGACRSRFPLIFDARFSRSPQGRLSGGRQARHRSAVRSLGHAADRASGMDRGHGGAFRLLGAAGCVHLARGLARRPLHHAAGRALARRQLDRVVGRLGAADSAPRPRALPAAVVLFGRSALGGRPRVQSLGGPHFHAYLEPLGLCRARSSALEVPAPAASAGHSSASDRLRLRSRALVAALVRAHAREARPDEAARRRAPRSSAAHLSVAVRQGAGDPRHADGAVLRGPLSHRDQSRLAGRVRLRGRAVASRQRAPAHSRQLPSPVSRAARPRPARLGCRADHARHRFLGLRASASRVAPESPTSLDRRRLFLHVEAQILRRALREKDLAIISTYGGSDAVEQHLDETRGKLVDLRGVGNTPTDVFFWTTDRLRTPRWSRTPGPSGPARSAEVSS